jgi:hypothetical protein
MTTQRQGRVCTDDRMWRPEAARYLRQIAGEGSVSLLAKMASTGTGPSFYRYGKAVFYTRADLDEWARKRTQRVTPGDPPQRSTSEAPVAA